MKSIIISPFWKRYAALPEVVQRRADKAYKMWQANPYARGLNFKRVGKQKPIYSVRIGRNYRALGLLESDAILWFWIGAHDEYERLLKHI